jgi:hypothetical protein
VYADEPATGTSTADVAKDQAATVAGSAGSAGQHVASVAKDEAANVATEAKGQARNVLGQARTELTQQAGDQQQRVAGGLRSLGTELGSMADGSQEAGLATDLARQASEKAHEVAEWLENRDPSSLLDEVKTFARQRPGTFLALALVAGVAAGRLGRGLKDDAASSTPTGSTTGTAGTPAASTTYGNEPLAGVSSYDSYEPAAGTGYVEEPVASPVYSGEATYTGGTAYAPPAIDGDVPVHTDGPDIEKTTYTGGDRL